VADLRAIDHKTNVRSVGRLAVGEVVHRRLETDAMAVKTSPDALLHLHRDVLVAHSFPFLSHAPTREEPGAVKRPAPIPLFDQFIRPLVC
jgi:hypothetical protein